MTEPNEKLKEQLLAFDDSADTALLPDGMKPPVTADDNEHNYIFISYSHKDYKSVYCDLLELADSGLRYWYDRDLTPGRSWSEEVKKAIRAANCAGVIFYLSENFVLSDSILNEVKFALGDGISGEAGCGGKNFFAVSLSTSLPETLIKDTIKSMPEKEGGISPEERAEILLRAFPNEKTNIVKGRGESNSHIDKMIETLTEHFNVIAESRPFYDKKEMKRRLDLAGTFAIRDGVLMKYLGTEEDVTVPCGIFEIADGAFEGSAVTSVVIPEGVTKIGRYAFRECRSLSSVSLPEGLILISEEAFCGCLALKDISLPSTVGRIAKNAFKKCRELYDEYDIMYIGDTVVGCYEQAFDTPNKVLRQGTRRITDSAFENVHGLETVTLPEGLEEIGFRAFQSCDELREIYLPDSVSYIGDCAFSLCTSLVSVRLPDTLTELLGSVFYGCEALEHISLPDTLLSVGDSAFAGCRSLRTLLLPEGIEEIQSLTFSGCSSLETITLPESVRAIGIDAFALCTSLWDINIPSAVEAIGTRAFNECEALKSLDIPPIEFIQQRMCFDCTSLEEIRIPEGVSYIRYSAFFGCKSLCRVYLPRGLERIDNDVFGGCDKLCEVYFDDTAEAWQNLTFGSLTFPKGCVLYCTDREIVY